MTAGGAPPRPSGPELAGPRADAPASRPTPLAMFGATAARVRESRLGAAVRHGLPLLLAVYRRIALPACVAVAAALCVQSLVPPGASSVDAHAYFRAAADPATMYSQHAVDTPGSYMYAPAFAQALAPLAWLGWAAFDAAWYVLLVAALWWLAREWSLLALLVPVAYPWSPPPLYLPVGEELWVGNIQLLLSCAFALSLRWPAAWSLPLLTKPSSGVGLIWYVARREWRNLAIALGATAMVAIASLALAPGLWFDWVAALAGNATGAAPNAYDAPFWFVPLAPRLVVAAALVAWGARVDRRWTLIVGTLLAMPVVWRTAPVLLLGLLGLLRVPRKPETASA